MFDAFFGGFDPSLDLIDTNIGYDDLALIPGVGYPDPGSEPYYTGPTSKLKTGREAQQILGPNGRPLKTVTPTPQPNLNNSPAVTAGTTAAGLLQGYNRAADKATYAGLRGAQRALKAIDPKGGVALGHKIGRFAGSPVVKNIMRVGTGLGAASGVLGAVDVVTGEESAANKLMDTAAMTIGGFIGAPGGPMGIAAGAGIGKSISDGAQWLFGDKKTPQQRKMEEALMALKGGQY